MLRSHSLVLILAQSIMLLLLAPLHSLLKLSFLIDHSSVLFIIWRGLTRFLHLYKLFLVLHLLGLRLLVINFGFWSTPAPATLLNNMCFITLRGFWGTCHLLSRLLFEIICARLVDSGQTSHHLVQLLRSFAFWYLFSRHFRFLMIKIEGWFLITLRFGLSFQTGLARLLLLT